jgi:hypothetical protein
LLGEEASEALTRQPVPFSNLARLLGHRDLEHRLRCVDRDRRTIHVGSSFHVLWTQGDSGTSMPLKSREERFARRSPRR